MARRLFSLSPGIGVLILHNGDYDNGYYIKSKNDEIIVTWILAPVFFLAKLGFAAYLLYSFS